jgi:hypothetical protein
MQNPDHLCPPHHWMITEQAGPFQQWLCLRCGEAKEQERDPHSTDQSSYRRGLERARIARRNKKSEDNP